MNESNNLDEEAISFVDGDSGDEVEEKPAEEPFPDTVKILESENGGKVYLIGTAHFSEESCKDVESVIRRVQPNVVVLEICSERITTLTLDEKVLMKRIMNFTFGQAREIIAEYGLMQGFIQILFLSVSKSITQHTGMLPGSEIRRAVQTAAQVPHCICHLGDRPFQITFKRAIGSLTLYQKLKLTLSILFSNPKMSREEVEKYKQSDILESYLNELAIEYPLMKKALVDERDQYLAYSLQVASRIVPKGENAFYIQRLKESRNSLALVDQQLVNCKHELENFKKIKSQSARGQESPEHDAQIEKYEMKLENLENQYSEMQAQVIADTQKVASFQQMNADNYAPSVVVGVVGMGHVQGIQRFFNKVTEADVQAIIEIPKTTLQEKLVGKAVKYGFYGLVLYGICRYALPNNVKEAIAYVTIKSVSYSKELINERILVRKL